MKKEIKGKIAVATLGLAAGIGAILPVSTFAAEGDVPSASDVKEVTINNIEDAATVTAYRIVTPNYNEEGFVSFKKVDGVNLSDIENPTSAEITTIAQGILNGDITPDKVIELEGTGTTYKASLPAGEYIVLVKNATNAQFIYNPMVVSTYYEDSNEADSLVAAPAIDAESLFLDGAYAKKTTIALDKEITNADGETIVDDDSVDGSQADDLGVGDTGEFTIRTQIPAYSDVYKAKGVIYNLIDTQDEGLDAPTDIVVTVGEEVVVASDATFTQVITGNDFTLYFNSDFTIAHAGQDVVVTYKAKLNNNASQKFEANNNRVRLEFTNDAYDEHDIAYLEDDVQEYTFPVQIRKVAEVDSSVEATYEGLEGAEFTLTRINADGKTGTNTYTITTNEDGIAEFARLDEGTYTVQETKAPRGYAINPTVFEITITPKYNADGSLEKYEVTMVDTDKDLEVGSVIIDSADDDILVGNITDSKLQPLPSSGGAGTRIATIIACGLAGITLGLVVYGKKKETQE